MTADDEQGHRRRDPDRALEDTAALVHEQHHGRRDQRHQDRHDDQMVDHACHWALPPIDMVGARQAARGEQDDQEQGRHREADDNGGEDQRLRYGSA